MIAKHVPLAIASLLLLGAVLAGPAASQCILANPSFEIGGSAGAIFGGWYQFGVVGSVSEAHHGFKAARVSGPDNGGWGVSGFWQDQDCVPGEQWQATGHVLDPSNQPLTGQSIALVNVEWHDADGTLIDYDSFTVAQSSSPRDHYLNFSVLSSPAPAGTATARLLLGVLQGPGDPSPDVYYDQVTFYSTSPPTIDDQQWNDFPSGRTVSLGGYSWRVKGPGVYGPGNNYFCNTADCVWVDVDGRLHLTLKNGGGAWSSTEVTNETALGYGDYIATTVGRLDQIDPQAVLGIFLWQYGPCYDTSYLWWNPYNEIDVEYSRWGNPGNAIGQFVAQPADHTGNLLRFDATFTDGELTSHAMRWLPDRVEFRAWRGGPQDESLETMIYAWTYTGPHIPRPEQPRMHLNLWKLGDTPAANQEVIFSDFNFVPAAGTAVGDGVESGPPATPTARLYAATPNPFNPQTTVRFDLFRSDVLELSVYDLGGHLVQTLASGYFETGEQTVTWNGRDDQGRPLGSGVYLLRLRGSGFVQTRAVTLLK